VEFFAVLLGPSLDGASPPDPATTGEHGRWFWEVG
jgi:hypothetical protein